MGKRFCLEKVLVVKEMIYEMRKVIKEKDIIRKEQKYNRWIF
jgi:hypothetical protein